MSIAGEISMPVTEHSAQILTGSWPSQGEMAWSGYSQALTASSHSLFEQLQVQHDIQSLLAGQSGAFIDAARQLVMGRQYALMNRIAAYRNIADKAHWAANAVHETKADLVEIVDKAEEAIKAAREAAEQAKIAFAAVPGAAAQIDAQLATDISSIVSTAKADAVLRDSEGAATVTGLVSDINTWKQPYANFMMPQGETPATGAPQAPAQPAPTTPSQPVDFKKPGFNPEGLGQETLQTTGAKPQVASPGGAQQPAQSASGADQSQKSVEQTALRNDSNQVPVKDAASAAAKQPSVPSLPASPPAASSPGSGAAGSSSAANPGSLVGQIFKPMTSSPATSSAPAASSAGSPMSAAPVSAAAGGMPSGAGGAGAPHAGAPAAGGGAGNAGAGMAGGGGGPGAGVGGAGRAVGAGAAGAGIAEASARMGTGAISSAASAAGNAAGLGSQAAQSVSAPAAAAAAGAPAAAAGAAGGAPMAMMPPAAAGAAAGGGIVGGGGGAAAAAGGAVAAGGGGAGGVLGPAAAGAGVPTTAAAAAGGPLAAGMAGAAGGMAAGAAAPLFLDGSPLKHVGAGGVTGDELFGQAGEAARWVLQVLVAQTRAASHIPITWAVSLIWDRSGRVSAWLASSEGPSYIPVGVRIPEDVRLAITDPVVGRELWAKAAAEGVCDPLAVLARHAEIRDATAPGSRVLAIGSTAPMQRTMDWAGSLGARGVGLDARSVAPATALELGGVLLHRCQVAMPWDWRQANAFGTPERLQVAARHMRMAAVSGHLNGRACEQVMRLFEERKPISSELWAEVQAERTRALVDYQIAASMAQQGGASPEQAFRHARAAEVIAALEHFDTVEGCADLLYATRLAGAPLNPAAAVA